MVRINDIILVTRNARDKIQTAQYILEQEGNTYFIRRYTGQFGCKITEQPLITIEKGKVKRSALQQAELEFNSLIKKACDKGYKKLNTLTKTKWEDITAKELDQIVPSIKTDANGVIKPQLAKSSSDCAVSVFEKDFFASRKIDGIRCMMRYNQEEDIIETSSRGGGDYDVSTTSIREDEQLLELFRKNPNLILDGELYVHGWSLQKISGTCRLQTWEERCDKLEFWVFDYVDSEKSFNNRLDFLIDLGIEFKDNKKVKILEHELISGWSKIKKLHDEYVKEGFEGLVLRKVNSIYSPGKRNSDWIKYKEYKDDCFKIVGWEPGLRPVEDMVFVLQANNGKTFKAKPIGDFSVKEDYINNINDCIGKMGEVKYFILSDEGTPVQPVFKAIRHDI